MLFKKIKKTEEITIITMNKSELIKFLKTTSAVTDLRNFTEEEIDIAETVENKFEITCKKRREEEFEV